MLSQLRTFLPIAKKVHDRRTKIPVLNHCVIDSGYIRMTDLETTVQMPIDDLRAYTLPVKVLDQILKTKPESFEIHLSDDDPNHIQIEYDGNRLTCPTIDPDEYPVIKQVPYQELGQWTPETFLTLKAQCQFASTDDLKPALNGVWFTQNGTLETCSTDGHLLKYHPALQTEHLSEAGKEHSGIIPPKTVKILARFAKGPVQVFASGEQMKFVLPNQVEIYTRLVDEQFPDFKPLLKIDAPNALQVDTIALLQGIESAKPFTNTTTYQGIVQIQERELNLIAENLEQDLRFETHVPVQERSGDRMVMGFNLQYFQRLLKSMDMDTLQWRYKSPISGSLFTDPDQNGEGSISLLMPIRLESDEKEVNDEDGDH